MSNAFASALEISAQIIRENLTDPTSARRLITERMHAYSAECVEANEYLKNMQEGYKALLAGMYAIARRGER